MGYEINFNRHFLPLRAPRPLEAIDADLKRSEEESHASASEGDGVNVRCHPLNCLKDTGTAKAWTPNQHGPYYLCRKRRRTNAKT